MKHMPTFQRLLVFTAPAQFVYALPRSGGYEFFVSQYSNHQVFFTSLLEYKTHGENARALVTLTNYIDLMKVC